MNCPIPDEQHSHVRMAHGSGGSLMRRLIEEVFLAAFGGDRPPPLNDSAVLSLPPGRLALTTDSYVVSPLFFPGGDIGTLAVNGTVNDLAVAGARPLYLTAGFILEEGLPMETLEKIVSSMQQAAAAAAVRIVTGDTKVVEHGKCDGIFINTAGVGLLEHDLEIGPSSMRPGDAVIVSGDIGRHGIAVMAAREGIALETSLQSDCAPLAGLVQALLEDGIRLHCMRDLTRGGLASAAIEISRDAHLNIALDESRIPVGPQVSAACELLGLDPLYIANEGRLLAVLDADDADRALEIMHRRPESAAAQHIGTVTDGDGRVILRSVIGSERVLDLLSGDQLPRIC